MLIWAWMQSNLDKPRTERIAESKVLAAMLAAVDQCPKLVIGRINGQAFGGGLGLIAVCDIAIGDKSARFFADRSKAWSGARQYRTLCDA